MLAYFCSNGFELADVLQIIAYRLDRPVHRKRASVNHMEWINRQREHHGLPRMCELGMANWDRDAVTDFLMRVTSDTDMLGDLLWFHAEYIPLLHTVCRNAGPFRIVLC